MNLPPPASLRVSRRAFLTGASATGAFALGPFATASASSIEIGTDIVRTSGFASSANGSALYIADPAVDRAYVAANPRTSFLSANGRGFRLSRDQMVTPAMFGAITFPSFTGSQQNFVEIPDSMDALRAFFAFCAVNPVEANWGGVYGIGGTHVEGLVLGGPAIPDGGDPEGSAVGGDSFAGSLYLAVKPGANIRYVMVNNLRAHSKLGPLKIVGPPTTRTDHAARVFDVGVLFQNKSSAQVWGPQEVACARYAGVLVQNGRKAGDNSSFNHFENSSFNYCGSGAPVAASAFDSAQILTRVDTGPFAPHPDESFQRSTVTVDKLYPAWFDEFGSSPVRSALPVFVTVNNQTHQVMSINRTTKEVAFFPLLPAGYTGELGWVYGGGLVVKGGDVGILTGKFTAANCSIGVTLASLYNGHINYTGQNNYLALLLGRYTYEGSGGGGSSDVYFEGNNHDILDLSNGVAGAGHTVNSIHNPDFNKIQGMRARRPDGTLQPWVNKSLLLRFGQRFYPHENTPTSDGQFVFATVDFAQPNSNVIPIHGDGPSINVILPPDTLLMDRYGYRARTIQVVGNGPNREPGIGVTIRPVGEKKINGGTPGAAYVFRGFTGPAIIQLSLDPADPLNNCLATVLSGRASAV